MTEILEKIKAVLQSPGSFFDSIKSEEGYGPALKYLFVIYLVPSIIVFIAGMLSSPGKIGEAAFIAVLSEVFGVLVLTFISTGLVHIGIMLVGGKRGIFSTYKALAYGITPYALLQWIPIVNILALLWAIYLEVMGLSKLHEMSMLRAFIGWLIVPLILLVILTVLFSAVLIGTLGVLFSAASTGKLIMGG